MRRFVTVTLLGLALAGCSATAGSATLLPSSASQASQSSLVTAVTSVNETERAAALAELCKANCDTLISSINEVPCDNESMCRLLTLRLGERLLAYSNDVQDLRARLNLTDDDAVWINELAVAMQVYLDASKSNTCAGMTTENSFSFGRCSNEVATLMNETYKVGATLKKLANA